MVSRSFALCGRNMTVLILTSVLGLSGLVLTTVLELLIKHQMITNAPQMNVVYTKGVVIYDESQTPYCIAHEQRLVCTPSPDDLLTFS